MALMAIAMGLNACSSDDPVVNAGGGNVPFAEGGYVKMAINMPSAPSSRAAYSENFGDGLENEYEVKNATLILFEGTSEDAAKFHSAYDLPVSMTKDGNTQITSTTKIVKKVDNSVPAGNLYGYVLLNHNGLLTYSSDTKGARIATTLSVDGMALNDAAGNKTFKDFREKVITGGASKFNTTGFLMDNAPLSSEKGGADFTAAPAGTAKTQTLVNLTNKVYKSQAEAEAKPATDVYVERALAKVTMTKAASITNQLTGSGVSSVTGSPAAPSTTVKYTIEGWTLDVTNNKSYLGRSYDVAWNNLFSSDATVATAEKYRFVGHSAVGTSALYRTYWGIDPNYGSYDDTKATENFTYLNAKPKDTTKPNITNPTTYNGLGENNPLYCMENTFNVANMQDRQITRAIVKVKFFDGQPFYTFNDDKSTLYDEANMEKHIKQIILSNPDVLTKLATDFSGATIDENNIDLAFEPRDKDGKKILKSYKVTVGGTVNTYVVSTAVKPGTTERLYANLNQELQLGNIVEYEGGIAYYPIRIKHFGDEQTPWNKTTADMTNPYGTTKQAENFLGRYGVLRNNWYNIEISSIKNVGSAVVPEIKLDDPTPGDKPENYISVRINVLSWARRNQSESL